MHFLNVNVFGEMTVRLGSTSRSFRRCCYLPVQVPEEIVAGTWCMELPSSVKVDPLLVLFPSAPQIRNADDNYRLVL